MSLQNSLIVHNIGEIRGTCMPWFAVWGVGKTLSVTCQLRFKIILVNTSGNTELFITKLAKSRKFISFIPFSTTVLPPLLSAYYHSLPPPTSWFGFSIENSE